MSPIGMSAGIFVRYIQVSIMVRRSALYTRAVRAVTVHRVLMPN